MHKDWTVLTRNKITVKILHYHRLWLYSFAVDFDVTMCRWLWFMHTYMFVEVQYIQCVVLRKCSWAKFDKLYHTWLVSHRHAKKSNVDLTFRKCFYAKDRLYCTVHCLYCTVHCSAAVKTFVFFWFFVFGCLQINVRMCGLLEWRVCAWKSGNRVLLFINSINLFNLLYYFQMTLILQYDISNR